MKYSLDLRQMSEIKLYLPVKSTEHWDCDASEKYEKNLNLMPSGNTVLSSASNVKEISLNEPVPATPVV